MGNRNPRKINYYSSRINKKIKKATIHSLPHELLTEVLARTAASSSTCLFNAKLSNKIFNEAANDNYVFRNMSVEKSPLLSWRRFSNKVASCDLWERCKKSGNLEALYIQGVVDYFGSKRQEESGHELLDKAAKLGHHGARYILGIIQLLNEDEGIKKQGVETIGDMIKSNIQLRECRNKLKLVARTNWLSNQFGMQRPKYCTIKERHGQRSGWGGNEEDDTKCDACRCESEVAVFCSLFPNG